VRRLGVLSSASLAESLKPWIKALQESEQKASKMKRNPDQHITDLKDFGKNQVSGSFCQFPSGNRIRIGSLLCRVKAWQTSYPSWYHKAWKA
jgi:hypothetical protein